MPEIELSGRCFASGLPVATAPASSVQQIRTPARRESVILKSVAEQMASGPEMRELMCAVVAAFERHVERVVQALEAAYISFHQLHNTRS
jgi:hypothetical protein